MPSPKKEIDYRLRPAKYVERKMMCEAFRLLSSFEDISSYRYIGFGARYFVDFSLFHKEFGISKMISIEKDTSNKARYDFNRPYDCIAIEPGAASSVLPRLSWKDKTILWLDYDGSISEEVIADTSFFFTSAKAGSVFILTLNAHIDLTSEDQVKELASKGIIPPEVEAKELAGNGFSKALRKLISDKIADTLHARNGSLPQDERLFYTQIFNFHYQDSVRMMTVGGILWNDSQRCVMEPHPFSKLSFVRTGEDSYHIDIPKLTIKEVQFLDTHLPIGTEKFPSKNPVPKGEREKYKKIYRYFPNYAIADF